MTAGVFSTDTITGKIDVENIGIRCPYCQSLSNRVVDSRPSVCGGKGSIRRHRKCETCNERWVTVEITEGQIRSMRGDLKRAVVADIIDGLKAGVNDG